MKVLILYQPDSEHATTTESFVRDFRRQYETGKQLELVSMSTREGANMGKVYDVWSYPAIIAIADDGAVLNIWQGLPLPLMDEVSGYVFNR